MLRIHFYETQIIIACHKKMVHLIAEVKYDLYFFRTKCRQLATRDTTLPLAMSNSLQCSNRRESEYVVNLTVSNSPNAEDKYRTNNN